MKNISIPGINIQWPWSRLILDGKKTIETRSYPLPDKYKGSPLAIIETPGLRGRQFGITEAKIIGIVTFSDCFQYESFEDWAMDHDLHLVSVDDPQFHFSAHEEKWAWTISRVETLRIPRPAPYKRGIVFAAQCNI